jgi:tripartite-type tricarboxylate transporter receptor subunit TctC
MVIAVSPYVAQTLSSEAAWYDLGHFNWLARFTYDSWVLAVRPQLNAETVEQLRSLPAIRLGVLGRFEVLSVRSILLAEALGLANARVIAGYGGTAEVELAVFRGEMHGFTPSVRSALESFRFGQLAAVVLGSETRSEMLPDVPTVFELDDLSSEGRALMEWESSLERIGRTFVSPPHVPTDRVKFLEAALEKTLKDEALLSEAQRRRLEVKFLNGSETRALVLQALDLDQEQKENLNRVLDKYR